MDTKQAASAETVPPDNTLLQVLDLEEIDTDLFRGYCPEKPRWGRIYGGQTISQALVAAGRTVLAPFQVHSLHLYFLRPGNDTKPVLYSVSRSFDGNTFCSRSVRVRQAGHTIATVQLSFQKPESGLEHQIQVPDVPSADDVMDNRERLRRLANDASKQLSDRKRAALRAVASLPFPMEMREILPSDYPAGSVPASATAPPSLTSRPTDTPPSGPQVPHACKTQWVRTVELHDSPLLHNAALAYLSDWGLLEAATRPHGVRTNDRRLQIASLDHAMWFHKPFKADQWLLFVMDSQRAAGGRGLVTGRFYQNGELVVTVAQEGLIRLRHQPLHRPPNRMAVPANTSATTSDAVDAAEEQTGLGDTPTPKPQGNPEAEAEAEAEAQMSPTDSPVVEMPARL